MATEEHINEESRGRRESFEEKLDRNWNELLQELRVMQTGAQIITAFLMTLPFQSRFEDLEDYQVGLYIALLVFSALMTGVIMAPVAIHRQLFGLHVKDSTVAQGHRFV
ncbi:sodium:proton antiporter, partial [Arthrobacter deserti]|nr:sodium:proton antiporter [Arthrobacter deserti]